MVRSFICIIFFLAVCSPAAAQETPDDQSALKHAEKVETEIDENMVTMSNLSEALSHTLGQLHYLRTLCFSDQDQKWRNIAADMMKLEAPEDSARRQQLIRAFNDGYYMQKERYSQCAKTVSIDVAALAENGRRLSLMLSDPYRERTQAR